MWRLTPIAWLLAGSALAADSRSASRDDAPATRPAEDGVRVTALPAASQSATPLSAQSAAGPITLERFEPALEVGGEFEQRRVRTQQGPFDLRTNQRNRRWQADETLEAELEGYVRDPELFSFGGRIGLGLSQQRFQEWFDTAETVQSRNGTLNEFDLRADLFRGSPVSASVFGLQTVDRYPRAFLPTLDERRTEYGTAISLGSETLPMELRVERRDVDRDGDPRDLDNERITQNLLAYRATWNPSAAHSLRLDFEYDDREERYSGAPARFDTDRYQVRVEDALTFGPQDAHRLESVLRYQQESGDVARDLFEAGPRLTLRHTEALATHYQYQFSRERLGLFDVDSHRADVGLEHQLFSNLTSTFNLFALKEDVAGDTETEEYGGTADWSYVRENAAGVLSADVGLSHDIEHTRGGRVRVQLRESAAFRDPLAVELARPGVLTSTIVVWNAARTRPFARGRDYLVTVRGGRTRLVRQWLGRIRSNETVSIDYVYLADAAAQRGTTRADFRVQQAFASGWTPYYAFESRHEDRDRSSGAPRIENDLSRHRAGLKYQRPRWSAGGEFEALKDNLDPFLAYRVFGDVSLVRTGRATLDARAELSHFFFERQRNRDVVQVETGLDGVYDLSERASAFSRLTYRYEDDRLRGTVHAVDLESGAEYRWGPYTVTGSVEYDLFQVAESHEDGLTVWLKLRRTLGDLTAWR